MKIIKISEENLKTIKRLYGEFYEVHGSEDAVWNLLDIGKMRLIGQEFMEIFSDHLAE